MSYPHATPDRQILPKPRCVLEAANERLIELQKANAVAQSETLGTFLLEAERIRKSQDGDDTLQPSPSRETSTSESFRTDV